MFAKMPEGYNNPNASDFPGLNYNGGPNMNNYIENINSIGNYEYENNNNNNFNNINKTYKSFTEKAKKNILKMILPTKLKAILKNYARKELIKDLKGYKKN